MIKKNVIAVSVGAVFVAVTGPSYAEFDPEYNSVIIPYVVKDANRTTIVTLIGDGQPLSIYPNNALHLQYWTKSTTDANTAACQPSSIMMSFTESDIVSFDTAGLLGYPLFGDVTNNAPLGTTISYSAPRHGYLFVEGASISSSYINSAYWLELDLANGSAHGDTGILFNTTDLTPATGSRIARTIALRPDTLNSSFSEATAVPFWPTSIATTVFTVTPLGSDMETRENNQAVLQIFNANEVQGAYDRNENGIDGTVPNTVRCVGRLTPAQLMPGVVANPAWAAQGGWGYLTNLGDGNTTANQAQTSSDIGDLDVIAYQVDSSNAAGGRLMSNATRIATSQNE